MTDAAGAAALDYEGARYSRGAIWLHWLIAALVLVNIVLGLVHDSFGKAATPWIMTPHKSIGFIVLALTLIRIFWRFTNRPPALDPVLKPWETGLARAVHGLFYLLLLALPLTGWLTASYSRVATTKFFWLFNIGPLPVAADQAARNSTATVHLYLAYAMLLLIVLHVGGALKHHLDGHRHLIGRMAPWLYRRI